MISKWCRLCAAGEGWRVQDSLFRNADRCALDAGGVAVDSMDFIPTHLSSGMCPSEEDMPGDGAVDGTRERRVIRVVMDEWIDGWMDRVEV